MIPSKIKLDPTFVNEDGTPSQSAEIFEGFLRVHPDYEKLVLQGLQGMFPDMKFEVEQIDG